MAAVTSIMRAQQILLGELDRILRPHGLTFARYEALVLLTFSRQGALPLRVIGERLMVHPTSVTNTIGRLEKQGMVVRRPNPRDGRGTLAEITGRGRAVVEHATRDLMAAEFGMGRYDSGQLKRDVRPAPRSAAGRGRLQPTARRRRVRGCPADAHGGGRAVRPAAGRRRAGGGQPLLIAERGPGLAPVDR